MIRHVVLLKFKEETPAHTQATLEQSFAGLTETISFIQRLEWGVNTSAEGLNKGFTHCFLVTFEDESARDAYLPHPAHQAFVEKVHPWLADVLVVDYVVNSYS